MEHHSQLSLASLVSADQLSNIRRATTTKGKEKCSIVSDTDGFKTQLHSKS